VLKLLTPSKKNVKMLSDILSLDVDMRSTIEALIGRNQAVSHAFRVGHNHYIEIDPIAKLLKEHANEIKK
jgi:hypothetical protein